jgi:2-methylcitrate dehydratase PrpD
MAALVAGFEVQGQIMRAIGDSGIAWPNGVHAPGIVGPLGAAVTSGKLLGLGEDELRMALGIAGSRIGSLMANIGTMTKSTHSGNAARMGLESALLAAQGFTASPAILESKFGLNEAFFQNALDMDSVAVRLGNPYRMVDPGLVVKKYPCQYPTHWSIDAAIDVVAHNSFRPSEIRSVVVEVGADNVAAQFWELEDGLSGKFSVAYTVAAALLDGAVGIETFRDVRLRAEDMQKLLPLIEVKLRPDVSAMDFAAAWSTVTVELSDGRALTSRVDRPLGIWDNPIPWDLWVRKYQDCAAAAVSQERADAILERIEHLDEIEDVGRGLVALLGAA